MENRKIFRFVTWGLFIAWLLAMAFLFALSLCSCSSSRKVAEVSHVDILSDSSFSAETGAYKEELTEHSGNAASLVADSVIIYPLRIAPESAEPPDIRPSFFPALAASLYGLRLDISSADSSSLLKAAVDGRSKSSSSVSAVADASKAEAEKVEEKGSSCVWGVVFFFFWCWPL